MQIIEVLDDLENEVATGTYINSLGVAEVRITLPPPAGHRSPHFTVTLVGSSYFCSGVIAKQLKSVKRMGRRLHNLFTTEKEVTGEIRKAQSCIACKTFTLTRTASQSLRAFCYVRVPL